ncbi:hypothetical protein ACN28S_12155 [Cystobacter fuscus]
MPGPGLLGPRDVDGHEVEALAVVGVLRVVAREQPQHGDVLEGGQEERVHAPHGPVLRVPQGNVELHALGTRQLGAVEQLVRLEAPGDGRGDAGGGRRVSSSGTRAVSSTEAMSSSTSREGRADGEGQSFTAA